MHEDSVVDAIALCLLGCAGPLEAPSSRPALPSRQMLLLGAANLENALFWGSMGVRVLEKWRRGGRCEIGRAHV